MQHELDAERGDLDLPIAILGMNEAGHESGNPEMCDGRELPWLQDALTVDVWKKQWIPVYRDVVMLDEENRFVGRFNLTEHNLATPENYQWLKARLASLASQ